MRQGPKSERPNYPNNNTNYPNTSSRMELSTRKHKKECFVLRMEGSIRDEVFG